MRSFSRPNSSRSHSACRLFKLCWSDSSEVAWNQFVTRYHQRICHLFIRLLRSRGMHSARQDLEDRVQDFYCRLLRQGQQFQGRSDRELWAYFETIAERLISDWCRFLRREKRQIRCVDKDPETLESIHSKHHDPEAIVLYREQRRVLWLHCVQQHVHGRSARLRRRALYMALMEGRPSREIADCLDVRPNYIDLLVHRFRRQLQSDGFDLPRRYHQVVDRNPKASSSRKGGIRKETKSGSGKDPYLNVGV